MCSVSPRFHGLRKKERKKEKQVSRATIKNNNNHSRPVDFIYFLVALIIRRENEFLELLVSDPHANVPRDEAREAGHESLVESGRAFLDEHPHGYLDGAAVLSFPRVHETRLDDVHGRGHDRRAESGHDGGCKMARHSVRHPVGEEVVLEHVVADDLGHVDDGVTGHVGQGSLPQAGHPFLLGDRAVGHHGGCVSRRRAAGLLHLGLHAHLDDVRRLGKQHGEPSRRNAGHDPHWDVGVVLSASDPSPAQLVQLLLVNGLDRVVEADADPGESHLTLQSRHQSVIKSPGREREEIESIVDKNKRLKWIKYLGPS